MAITPRQLQQLAFIIHPPAAHLVHNLVLKKRHVRVCAGHIDVDLHVYYPADRPNTRQLPCRFAVRAIHMQSVSPPPFPIHAPAPALS